MKVNDTELLATLGLTLGLAAVAQGLRLVSRRLIRVPLWYDDYFSIIAFVFACGWSAVVFTWIFHAGLGKPIEDVAGSPVIEGESQLDDIDPAVDNVLERARLLLFWAEILYAASLAFSKFAILSFYWRLFRLSNIRIPIQVLGACSALWLVVRTFIAVFHCVPVQAFWDRNIKDAKCVINDSQFFFWSVLGHLIIDLAILVLPVLQVGRLQLQNGQKAAVIGVFMFGIFVCIASVVVLCESFRFWPVSIEMPLEIAPIILWATIEVNLAIVSASLPMLKPLFNRARSPYGSDSSGLSKHNTLHMQDMTGKRGDEYGSKLHLAMAEPRPSNVSGFENIATTQTVIGRGTPDFVVGSPDHGILVRCETRVDVERA